MEPNPTKNYYDQNAASWAAAHDTDSRFWDLELSTFDHLLKGGHILDVGCGHGRDARELIKMGYNYTGVDYSLPQLFENQKRNPGARLVQADIFNLPFEDARFDGFWASASLLHFPTYRLNQALSEIHRVNRDLAPGFISVKEGKGEVHEDDGRYFAYYDLVEFADLLEASGFSIVSYYRNIKSPRTTFLVYFVEVDKN